MPDDRTLVTELGTALGMLADLDPGRLPARVPAALAVDQGTWDRLRDLVRAGAHRHQLATARANGRAFLGAADGLRHRPPRLVEWTAGRRPPGDEVAPIDLRIDHVYLVSCKYLSRNIANPSPGRLFDGLLATTGSWDRGDWYAATAPAEYAALYRACRDATGLADLPDDPQALTGEDRRRLRAALPGRAYPDEARPAYRALCTAVSEASARRWRAQLSNLATAELLLWRLLRIGNATYFLLGAEREQPLRLRVASAWDWRQSFRLLDLTVEPAGAGQPQVDWRAAYLDRRSKQTATVAGHVEVRWSHGKFAQPPEAKVYLDTPPGELPGYLPLGAEDGQLPLWG